MELEKVLDKNKIVIAIYIMRLNIINLVIIEYNFRLFQVKSKFFEISIINTKQLY